LADNFTLMKFAPRESNALISGQPGTGKSHPARTVAYQATQQGHDVRHVGVAAHANPP